MEKFLVGSIIVSGYTGLRIPLLTHTFGKLKFRNTNFARLTLPSLSFVFHHENKGVFRGEQELDRSRRISKNR